MRGALMAAAAAYLDKVIASPRFRRFAAGFPVLRPVARRRSKALFDLMAGFVYSQVLLAFTRLDLPNLLLEKPRSFEELMAWTQLDADHLRRLLKAAKALDLVSYRGPDIYGLGTVGRDLANNAAALSMIEHHAGFYADLNDPIALLTSEQKSTGLNDYWRYVSETEAIPEELAAKYSTLMSQSQEGLSEEIIDDYTMTGRRHILDVGGGDGTFLRCVAARVGPETALTLFDLPAVAETAKARLAERGLEGRISAVGGDFLTSDFPDAPDLVTLVRVLFDHPDRTVRPLLGRIRAALAPDGALLIAEPMSETRGGERIADAYFGFYLLAMGEGRVRTVDEHTALLKEAGFSRIRPLSCRMPHMIRLIEARP